PHTLTLTLTNLYGPTEATIDVTATTTHPTNTTDNTTETNTATTIGTPVWNTQTYILDPHLQPTPTGTPREHNHAGHQHARGNTNHPTHTPEPITANPNGPPRTPQYRTG
ncbi:AMP-binding protein, partial [Streptomyces sp. DT17]